MQKYFSRHVLGMSKLIKRYNCDAMIKRTMRPINSTIVDFISTFLHPQVKARTRGECCLIIPAVRTCMETIIIHRPVRICFFGLEEVAQVIKSTFFIVLYLRQLRLILIQQQLRDLKLFTQFVLVDFFRFWLSRNRINWS